MLGQVAAKFIRVTALRITADQVAEGLRRLNESVLPQLRHQVGYEGLSVLIDRRTGATVVISRWPDRTALDRSDAAASPLRTEAAAAAGAREGLELETYELAHDERLPGDAWFAALEIDKASPESAGSAIARFQKTALPTLRALPGFKGASLGLTPKHDQLITLSWWEGQPDKSVVDPGRGEIYEVALVDVPPAAAART